jgi:hypothetical protein
LGASLYNKLQCAAEKLEIAATGTTGTVILSSGALTLHQAFIDGSQFYNIGRLRFMSPKTAYSILALILALVFPQRQRRPLATMTAARRSGLLPGRCCQESHWSWHFF